MHDRTRCYRCHGPLPGTPIPYAVGVIDDKGTTGKLFMCSQACRDEANREHWGKRPCVECGAPLPGEYDKAPGRRRQYCDRKCQSNAERRRTRVWKGAARSTLPNKLEDLGAMEADLRRVSAEIEGGKLLDATPASARNLLQKYERELHRHGLAIHQQAIAKRQKENWGEYEKLTRERVDGKRREFDAFMKSAGVNSTDVEMPSGRLA